MQVRTLALKGIVLIIVILLVNWCLLFLHLRFVLIILIRSLFFFIIVTIHSPTNEQIFRVNKISNFFISSLIKFGKLKKRKERKKNQGKLRILSNSYFMVTAFFFIVFRVKAYIIHLWLIASSIEILYFGFSLNNFERMSLHS